jgi:hypothetical protein
VVDIEMAGAGAPPAGAPLEYEEPQAVRARRPAARSTGEWEVIGIGNSGLGAGVGYRVSGVGHRV